ASMRLPGSGVIELAWADGMPCGAGIWVLESSVSVTGPPRAAPATLGCAAPWAAACTCGTQRRPSAPSRSSTSNTHPSKTSARRRAVGGGGSVHRRHPAQGCGAEQGQPEQHTAEQDEIAGARLRDLGILHSLPVEGTQQTRPALAGSDIDGPGGRLFRAAGLM